MEPFAIESRIVVSGGSLKEPVILRDVRVVDGIQFVAIRNTDSIMHRVLTGKSWKTSRGLGRSSTMATVRRLRDDAIDRVVNPPAAVDLGIDDGDDCDERTNRKRARTQQIKMVDVMLPPIGDLDGVTAKVLVDSTLFVQLNPSVLRWLAVSIAGPNIEAPPRGDDAEQHSLPKYISYDQVKQAYRVRYKDTNKWFSEKANSDALNEAIQYAQSLVDHPKGCDDNV